MTILVQTSTRSVKMCYLYFDHRKTRREFFVLLNSIHYCFIIISLCLFAVGCANPKPDYVKSTAAPESINTDSLVGTYSASQSENGGLVECLRIVKNGRKYYLDFKDNNHWDDALTEVAPMSKEEMEKLYGKEEAFKVEFTALNNDGEGVMVVYFPNGWKDGDFNCKPGFWFMGVAGPVELHKN